MEICGGQTHAIVRYRLEEMLPEEVKLLHGPGCPVCVTPVGIIDRALELAKRPDVILASFGDMMRVPGSREDLLQIKARGADIRILYSPLDAVSLAADHPDKKIVFFAIGFETTAPVHMMALKRLRGGSWKISTCIPLCSLYLLPSRRSYPIPNRVSTVSWRRDMFAPSLETGHIVTSPRNIRHR